MDISPIEDLKIISDIVQPYPDPSVGREGVIVIDNGSFNCRVGWMLKEKPALIFRNILAKPRKDRNKKDIEVTTDPVTQIGNDIVNIEALRLQLRTQFDRNVVTHYNVQEQIFDYIFAKLGINSENSVPHKVMITECLFNPNYCRCLMSELLFECYDIPGLSYGVDSLFSYYTNQRGKNGLIIATGYHTTHVVPVMNGRMVVENIRRINIGGSHMIAFLHRCLQLKYTFHINAITLSRSEVLLHKYGEFAYDYAEALQNWASLKYYDQNVKKIQLPYNQTTSAPTLTTEQKFEKKKELSRRLAEINARRREERLAQDEELLMQLQQLEESAEDGEDIRGGLVEHSIKDVGELKRMISTVNFRIEKTRQKMNAPSAGSSQQIQPESDKLLQPPPNMTVAQWVEETRRKRDAIIEKQQARKQRKQDLAKRRTAAAQERMRIISHLARKEKGSDDFGMRDEDWDVYKQISRDEDSDNENENERLLEYEIVLKQYDSTYEDPLLAMSGNAAELYQLHVGVERIRAPEILFQPSIIGSYEAGLSETIDFVLKLFPIEQRGCLVENIFLTGGCSKIRGLKERLSREMREMLPFESRFEIEIARDPVLDAWNGASKFCLTETFRQSLITRPMYEECGGEYIKEHVHGNVYFPTPKATKGKCCERKPAFWDVINRAKWDAWNRLGDMEKEVAMQKYVDELKKIVETMSYTDNVANFMEYNVSDLDNVSIQDLEMVAPDAIKKVRSRPNSPFASREASPNRLSPVTPSPPPMMSPQTASIVNGHVHKPMAINGYAHSSHAGYHAGQNQYHQTNGVVSSTMSNGASSGPSELSDDEYIDTYDDDFESETTTVFRPIEAVNHAHYYQNGVPSSISAAMPLVNGGGGGGEMFLHGSEGAGFTRNDVAAQITRTIERLNKSVQQINSRVSVIEQSVAELREQQQQQLTKMRASFDRSSRPTWWPFAEISPGMLAFIILWPLVINRITGEGLGKNSDGITAPLKASFKFSTSGIGANKISDAKNNWWERVYNEAASNIEVEARENKETEGPVSLRQINAEAVEITTKTYSVNKLKRKERDQNGPKGSMYGSVFLKASTLLGGAGREEEVPDHVRTEDIQFAPMKTLTDEELFAACGGRTAHKGARHGLGLHGKLARIDDQNNKLLKELESRSFEDVIKSSDWQVQQSKNGRRKSKKQKRNEQRWIEHRLTDTEPEVKDMIHHADYVVAKSKKKKKVHQNTDQELANEMSSMFAELPEEDGAEENKLEVQQTSKSKRSKGKSKKGVCLEDELDLLSEKIRKLDHSSVTIKKRDKKQKNKKKLAQNSGIAGEDDTAMLDPAAKYRKDYRPDLKQNNLLLRTLVPHEVTQESDSKKTTPLLRSDSSDEEEEDVVQRVNEEQQRYWSEMRANVPKINIIEPTEDDCLVLGQSLKERHKNDVKRVGSRTTKRKKSKKSQRVLAKLADSLSKNL
uniref:Actin-related protein 5 n=1 Tax=Anopheles christyi TaxID=43041 RepID=A0A182JXK8_9DIPT